MTVRRAAASLAAALVGCAAILLLDSCASAPRQPAPRDRFPLDPREELRGPFPDSVAKGWAALGRDEPAVALAEFAAARAEGAEGAGTIGWIEAAVLLGRFEPALETCSTALASGEPTVPLLVACGEANGRGGKPPAGYRLYVQALAKLGAAGPGHERPALMQRAEELRVAARDSLAALARVSAEEHRGAEARERMAEALLVAPESVPLRLQAAEMEEEAGENERAFQHYKKAYELEPTNVVAAERAGTLALDLNEHAFAVAVFDSLARTDPRFKPKAEEARLAFRVANWPVPEREAARSQRLTRAGAAALVWWMFPEVREARVSSGVIATDAVSRRDTRAFSQAVGLGLLEVDRETHRGNPDAALTLPAASRLLLRLLAVVRPAGVPCLPKGAPPKAAADSIKAADACGFWKESDSGAPTGPVFTRALDRVRSLASGPAGGGR
jgi:tetratricopeptide (TPR) repeat protein